MGISSSVSTRRAMANRGDGGDGVSAARGVAAGPSEVAVVEEDAQTMGISSSVSARRAMAELTASGAVSKGDGGDGVSAAGGAALGPSEAVVTEEEAQTMGISSSISARRAMVELIAFRAVTRGDRGDGVLTAGEGTTGPSEAAVAEEEAVWNLASGDGDLVLGLDKKSNGGADGGDDTLLNHDGGADGGWRRWRAQLRVADGGDGECERSHRASHFPITAALDWRNYHNGKMDLFVPKLQGFESFTICRVLKAAGSGKRT
ncbi:hypothetical protein COCNU_03G006020 [Cocos nucifera]|uniref:Uncharacterized protein n=1 Tax=Cocos nucifera TaxID=13894 RepID=A0A8K0MYE7_COCNU|nr:hypothetical protein COCNU_03G006020 [Cocos nucifera]